VPDAAAEFAALARTLTEAGEGGLHRELYNAINDAARPLAREIGSVSHLRPYMPDPYADVLASDLAVSVLKRAGPNPGVSLRAKGRARARRVAQLNAGRLSHPLWGNRQHWYGQAVRPGFFDDPVARAGPEVRRQIQEAVRRVIAKIHA